MDLPSQLQHSLDSMTNEIQIIVNKYIGADGSNKKQQKAECLSVIERLQANNLAFKQEIEPDFVIAHPENRWTMMLESEDLHGLLSTISNSGWVKQEVGFCVCIEIPPGDRGQQYIRENEILADGSGGFIARPSPNSRFCSLSGSHSNGILRCVLHETKGMDSNLCGPDGYLNKDLVLATCPSLEHPLTKGLEWIVIRWQVENAIEGFAAWLQDSLNVGSGAHRLQSKVQTLLQVHKTATNNKRLFNDFRWANIPTGIEKTRPHLAGCVGPMCEYVKNMEVESSQYSCRKSGTSQKHWAINRETSDQPRSQFLRRRTSFKGPSGYQDASRRRCVHQTTKDSSKTVWHECSTVQT